MCAPLARPVRSFGLGRRHHRLRSPEEPFSHEPRVRRRGRDRRRLAARRGVAGDHGRPMDRLLVHGAQRDRARPGRDRANRLWRIRRGVDGDRLGAAEAPRLPGRRGPPTAPSWRPTTGRLPAARPGPTLDDGRPLDTTREGFSRRGGTTMAIAVNRDKVGSSRKARAALWAAQALLAAVFLFAGAFKLTAPW